MPIPKNKSELQLAIAETYAKLKTDLEKIPHELAEQKTLDGHAKGTTMSIHNLVAYLIGWGELVLKWNDQIEKGQTVTFPAIGFKWTELGQLAQQFYQDYEADNYAVLLEKLDEVVNDILKLIKNTDNEKLYETAWYKHYPMGRMIQLNTSSPYKNARKRVRKFLKVSELKQ